MVVFGGVGLIRRGRANPIRLATHRDRTSANTGIVLMVPTPQYMHHQSAGAPLRRGTRGRHRPAFTLVELLVVMAVIGILTGLLLPALSAARERGRRTSCMGNLSQIGLAMASYAGDYNGYFPGGHGWNGSAADSTLTLSNYVEWFADSKTGQKIAVGGSAYGYPMEGWSFAQGKSTWNAIGFGDKPMGQRFQQGDLNMAPVNLGLLLTCNYLPDAHAFFCSSAPVTSGWDSPWDNPGDMKTAGGFNRDTLLRGDWDSMPICPYSTINFRMLRIPYNYRNAVAGTHETPLGSPLTVFYTLPQVTTSPNCPYFKTQRLLGARALVSDTFRKPRNAPQNTPGDGAKIHGGGYNILYGDLHVAWYNDQKGTIAHWPMSSDWNINLVQSGYAGDLFGDTDARTNLSRTMGVQVWHLFDVAAGLDVNAATSPP